MSRKITITNKIFDMIDDGVLEPYDVVLACLKYMSEDDVADMAHCNGFFQDDDTMEEDEEEDDSDPNGDWYDTSKELD